MTAGRSNARLFGEYIFHDSGLSWQQMEDRAVGAAPNLFQRFLVQPVSR